MLGGKIFPVFKSVVSRLIHMHRLRNCEGSGTRAPRGSGGTEREKEREGELAVGRAALEISNLNEPIWIPQAPYIFAFHPIPPPLALGYVRRAAGIRQSRRPVIKIIASEARSTRAPNNSGNNFRVARYAEAGLRVTRYTRHTPERDISPPCVSRVTRAGLSFNVSK